jgi:hypothetical protein
LATATLSSIVALKKESSTKFTTKKKIEISDGFGTDKKQDLRNQRL